VWVLTASEDPAAKIAGYASSLLGAKPERCEGAFSRAADSVEDDLLEFDEFPPEYFAFAVALLSEERFFMRAGVWNFLLVLSTEKEKLLEPHYRALAQAITDNYPAYKNEDLCLAVCDFIARNYEAAWARDLLNRLKQLETAKVPELRGFADDGLRILEREVARSMKSQH
jgi:hypothetical protein